MSWPVHVVSRTTKVAEARRRLVEYGVGRLPVLGNNGEVEGIVSRSDLEAVAPTARVQDCMTQSVITTDPGAGIISLVATLATNQIGAAPVVVDGHLVGIVAWSDLERVGINASAASCMLCGARGGVARSATFFDMPLCPVCTQSEPSSRRW